MFSRKVAPGIELRLFEKKDAEAVFAVVDRNRKHLLRLATVFGPLRQFNLAHPFGLGLRSGFCF